MSKADLFTRFGAEADGVAPARSHVDEILARYDEVDARLVACGFPPTSPWWRETIERMYRSGARQAVVRVGRRGGKSSTISRLAVVEVLYGRHVIPPGDVGVCAVVSTRRGEAANRLYTITTILDALGVAYKPCDGGVQLVDRPRAFRVYTASISGVSGFTAIFVLCDEVSKWKDNDTGVNPAGVVLESIRPTMATQPEARMWLVSSPMGIYDAHYDAFELGDGPAQITSWAPSWVANPTLTEDMTRALEANEATWEREYKAIPQTQAETALLSAELIEADIRPELWAAEQGHVYVATTDPATRGNAWTLVVTTLTDNDVRRVVMAREWRGSAGSPLDPDVIAAEQAVLLERLGIRHVIGDQWAADALMTSYRRAGLAYVSEPWTSRNKAEAYEHLAAIVASRKLAIPPDETVRRDLMGVKKVLTRTGESYQLTEHDGRHSDYAPAIAMGVLKAIAPPRVSTVRIADPMKRAVLNRSKDKQRQLPVTHRRIGK